MHSIRTKMTAMTVCVIVIAMTISALLGVSAIRNIGNRDADRALLLLCQTGQKDLNYYFHNVEQSVDTVSVPVDEINADWHRWSAEITVSFAVPLLAFVVLIMTFVGRITSPLLKLTRAAERISEGHYDCDLDYDKQDEIGILTNTFKKVIANLNVYIANLSEMAYVDALTGMRNRLALRHDYDSYQGHEVSVMMVDLNESKQINDTLGHEQGDRVLKETGKLLSDTFGRQYCYRYGGDEFLVIVPDLPASPAGEHPLRRAAGQ